MSNPGAIVRLVPDPNNTCQKSAKFCVQAYGYPLKGAWKNLGVIAIKNEEICWAPFSEFKNVIPKLFIDQNEYMRTENRKDEIFTIRLRAYNYAKSVRDGDAPPNQVLPIVFIGVNQNQDDKPIFNELN